MTIGTTDSAAVINAGTYTLAMRVGLIDYYSQGAEILIDAVTLEILEASVSLDCSSASITVTDYDSEYPYVFYEGDGLTITPVFTPASGCPSIVSYSCT